MSRRRLIFAKAGTRTSRMRIIAAWRLARRTFVLRGGALVRAFSQVRRFYRARRPREERDAIPPWTFPIRRRLVHYGRAWSKRRPSASEWWDRDYRVRQPAAKWLRH